MEAKKLSDAQKKHLTEIIGIQEQVKVQLANFIAYLRDEHDAPEKDYEIKDVSEGFIPRNTATQESATTVN